MQNVFKLHVYLKKRYHRRFIECAQNYYIKKLKGDEKSTVFENVIDFFNERWKITPKPYKYNEYVAKKNNLQSNESQEKRDTSMQPTIFIDNQGNRNYNKRKIRELPEFAARLHSSLRVKIFCDYILFNYEFLTGMFHLLTLNEVSNYVSKSHEISSFSDKAESNSQFEIKLLALMFIQGFESMKECPSSAISQIVSRGIFIFFLYFISCIYSNLIFDFI